MTITNDQILVLWGVLYPQGEAMPSKWLPSADEVSRLSQIAASHPDDHTLSEALGQILQLQAPPLQNQLAARLHRPAADLQSYKNFSELAQHLTAEPYFIINQADKQGIVTTPGSVFYLGGSNVLSFYLYRRNRISGRLELSQTPLYSSNKLLPQVRLVVLENGQLRITHAWGTNITLLIDTLKQSSAITAHPPQGDLKKLLKKSEKQPRRDFVAQGPRNHLIPPLNIERLLKNSDRLQAKARAAHIPIEPGQGFYIVQTSKKDLVVSPWPIDGCINTYVVFQTSGSAERQEEAHDDHPTSVYHITRNNVDRGVDPFDYAHPNFPKIVFKFDSPETYYLWKQSLRPHFIAPLTPAAALFVAQEGRYHQYLTFIFRIDPALQPYLREEYNHYKPQAPLSDYRQGTHVAKRLKDDPVFFVSQVRAAGITGNFFYLVAPQEGRIVEISYKPAANKDVSFIILRAPGPLRLMEKRPEKKGIHYPAFYGIEIQSDGTLLVKEKGGEPDELYYLGSFIDAYTAGSPLNKGIDQQSVDYLDSPLSLINNHSELKQRLISDPSFFVAQARYQGITGNAFYLTLPLFDSLAKEDKLSGLALSSHRPPFRRSNQTPYIKIEFFGQNEKPVITEAEGYNINKLVQTLIEAGFKDYRDSTFTAIRDYKYLKTILNDQPQALLHEARRLGITGNCFFVALGYRTSDTPDPMLMYFDIPPDLKMARGLQISPVPIVEGGAYFSQIRVEITEGKLKLTHMHGTNQLLRDLLASQLSDADMTAWNRQENLRGYDGSNVFPGIEHAPEVALLKKAPPKPLSSYSYRKLYQIGKKHFPARETPTAGIFDPNTLAYGHAPEIIMGALIADGWPAPADESGREPNHTSLFLKETFSNKALIKFLCVIEEYAPQNSQNKYKLLKGIPGYFRYKTHDALAGLGQLVKAIGPDIWNYVEVIRLVMLSDLEGGRSNPVDLADGIRALQNMDIPVSAQEREKFLINLVSPIPDTTYIRSYFRAFIEIAPTISSLRQLSWSDHAIWEVMREAVSHTGHKTYLPAIANTAKRLATIGFSQNDQQSLIKRMSKHSGALIGASYAIDALQNQGEHVVESSRIRDIIVKHVKHDENTLGLALSALPKALEEFKKLGWSSADRLAYVENLPAEAKNKTGVILDSLVQTSKKLREDEKWDVGSIDALLKRLRMTEGTELGTSLLAIRNTLDVLKKDGWDADQRRRFVEATAYHSLAQAYLAYGAVPSTLEILTQDGWSVPERGALLLTLGSQSAGFIAQALQAVGASTVELKNLGFNKDQRVAILTGWAQNHGSLAYQSFGIAPSYAPLLLSQGLTHQDITDWFLANSADEVRREYLSHTTPADISHLRGFADVGTPGIAIPQQVRPEPQTTTGTGETVKGGGAAFIAVEDMRPDLVADIAEYVAEIDTEVAGEIVDSALAKEEQQTTETVDYVPQDQRSNPLSLASSLLAFPAATALNLNFTTPVSALGAMSFR